MKKKTNLNRIFLKKKKKPQNKQKNHHLSPVPHHLPPPSLLPHHHLSFSLSLPFSLSLSPSLSLLSSPLQLNIANPATGAQKCVEFDDQKKLRVFFDDKRLASEVAADPLGDEYKGYVFKIMGGNDKQGFPMKQGVMQNKRVRLLLDKSSYFFFFFSLFFFSF